MKLGTHHQTTQSRTPYSIDYSDALDTGDYILFDSVVITKSAPDLVVDQITVLASASMPNARVRFFVSKGTNLSAYKLRIVATSADGTVFDDEVVIKVKDDN